MASGKKTVKQKLHDDVAALRRQEDERTRSLAQTKQQRQEAEAAFAAQLRAHWGQVLEQVGLLAVDSEGQLLVGEQVLAKALTKLSAQLYSNDEGEWRHDLPMIEAVTVAQKEAMHA